MKTFLVAVLGSVLVAFVNPASAYVVEVMTSVPISDSEDTAHLKTALQSALDDVLNNAIAFKPTMIILTDVRTIGDRIYLHLLLADRNGEEALDALSAEQVAPRAAPRATEDSTKTQI